MKQLHFSSALTPILLLSAATLIGCGSDASNPPGTGGVNGNGGLPSNGGAPANGGIPGNGGIQGNGGVVPGNGGTVGTGGGVGTTGGVGTSGGAPGSGGAPTTGGAPAGTGGASGTCETAGTWGILFEVGIKWTSTLVLQCPTTGCEGVQQLKLLSTRTVDSTGKVTDNARICSVQIPQFTTILGKTTILFPEAAWDTQPVTTVLTSTLVGTGVGATFTSPDNGIIVGATLANPATDPWPAPTATQSVDADGDSKPGVTANVVEADGVVTAIGQPNADKLYLAFRTVAAVTGKNDTCDKSTGTIQLKKVEQNIVGCRNVGGAADCAGQQITDINNNSPKWTPGTSSKLSMIRMAPTATCADIRGATF